MSGQRQGRRQQKKEEKQKEKEAKKNAKNGEDGEEGEASEGEKEEDPIEDAGGAKARGEIGVHAELRAVVWLAHYSSERIVNHEHIFVASV